MTDIFNHVFDLDAEYSAQSLYSRRLAFHNFTHVKRTLRFADAIIQSAAIKSSDINLKIIYYAVLFHDAGYIKDQKSLGFNDKESYAASLAEEYLSRRGLESNEITKVVLAIKATHAEADCKTLEEEIVRGADISGMAAPYPDFLNMSIAIKNEQEFFIGLEIDWAQWVLGSEANLSIYLNEKITCGNLFSNSSGPSLFTRRLTANINQLKGETAPS